MWTRNPSEIASLPDEQFFNGASAAQIQAQRSRVETALQMVNANPSAEAISAVCHFIDLAGGPNLTPQQMLAIYSLYPFERGRLALRGWGDPEVREDALNVVTNFFLGSRWPARGELSCMEEHTSFMAKLRRVAAYFGY